MFNVKGNQKRTKNQENITKKYTKVQALNNKIKIIKSIHGSLKAHDISMITLYHSNQHCKGSDFKDHFIT